MEQQIAKLQKGKREEERKPWRKRKEAGENLLPLKRLCVLFGEKEEEGRQWRIGENGEGVKKGGDGG